MPSFFALFSLWDLRMRKPLKRQNRQSFSADHCLLYK